MPRPRRRIAFAIGSFQGGGTEHYLVRLLRHLDRDRFAPFVVTLDDSGPLREEAHSLAPVYVVKLTGKLFNRQGLRELWRLRGWLKTQRIELVHALIDRPIIYVSLAAKLAGAPVVASHRNTRLPPTIGQGLRVLYFFTLRHLVAHVIPNSHAVSRWLQMQGVSPNHMTVVHNGIPRARLRPVADRPDDPAPVTLCMVGRLAASIKGQHLVIEAAARLIVEGHAVRLVLLGDGPDRDVLRRRVDELGIADFVEFRGYLPDPTEAIQQSDICMLASYHEGFPNVVVEYLAAGRPVVATAVGGVPEIVRNGETGLLVPPGDVDALTDALRRLIVDPELRRRMGRAGRALVEKEFTAEREAARTMEVYERVLAEHRR